MKKNIIFILGIALLSQTLFSSCHNAEQVFDDFDYTAVYFAYQSPVRTIVLGDDTYDTTLDNEHKCMIYATMGGCYSNDKVVTIDIEVANDLCDDLYFDDGSPVMYLPASYYNLTENKIVLNKSLSGGVVVELTDDFFADPLALSNNYVLPLRMVDVTNADMIIAGEAAVDDPYTFELADWIVEPKDYTLYCLKFINKWDANYLRRGVDEITIGAETTQNIRHEEYVEYDEVCSTSSASLTDLLFPVTILDAVGLEVECELLLSFVEDDCTITTSSANFTASGSGSFVEDGELKSWGDEDRDALYINYKIDYNGGEVIYNTIDTLVVRDRGIALETFNPNYEPTI